MPFIRDYSRGEVGEEDKIVIRSSVSPIEVAIHETLHIVILRLDGLDVAEVVDQDDAAWTRLVEPLEVHCCRLDGAGGLYEPQ